MSEVRPVLERIRDRFVPPEGGLERLASRRARKARYQRAGAAAIALVLSVASVAVLWSVFRPTPTPPVPAAQAVLPGTAVDLTVGGGSVWALTCDLRCGQDDGRRSEGSVVRIDPATGRVVALVRIERPHALAFGEGSVWVLDFWSGRVIRIDPETMRPVATIQLRLPFAVCEDCPEEDAYAFLPIHVTVGEGAVWVSTARGAVARIDPRTNEVAQVIELSPALTDDVAAGEGGVWVAEIPGVKQIDPATGQVTASLDLGVDPIAVQVVDGSVWVAGERVRWAGPAAGYESLGEGVLLRVDPESGRVHREIPLPLASRPAVGHEVVWMIQDDGTLTAIDPDLGEPIGRPLPDAGGILAPSEGAVWEASGTRVWKVVLCPTGPCIESEAPPEPTPTPETEASPTPPSGWVTYRDDDRGFSVAYPGSWHRAIESLTPILVDPVEILSVGTYELRPGGERCAQFPDRALDELGSEDAFVSIQEEPSLERPRWWSPRPAHFGPDDGRGDDESPGCLSQPKEFFHRWIPFQDRGRGFYAFVAIGKNASAQTQRAVWTVLDTLEFDLAPGAPATPDCGVTNIASDEYSTVMVPDRGPPGTGVVLTGPTLRGEDWRYAPADRVEVWWNTDVPTTQVPDQPPITPGPIVLLATEDVSGRCTFSAYFTVPDVPSGRYEVRVFMYDDSGYGDFLGHTFQVTG
jgi:streptogramin lyase